MSVRQLRTDELDPLLALYRHLHTDDDPLPARPAVEAAWGALLQNSALRVFGVFVNERLVASCVLAIIPNLTRGCRPYGVIENVVTHPSVRRRGHGRSLLAHALALAWQHGCYKVMLITGRKDEATYRFYESLGFRRDTKQAFLAQPPAVGEMR